MAMLYNTILVITAVAVVISVVLHMSTIKSHFNSYGTYRKDAMRYSLVGNCVHGCMYCMHCMHPDISCLPKSESVRSISDKRILSSME